MKFLIQRVRSASVTMPAKNVTNSIGQWFLVYVWVHKDDIDGDRKGKVDKFVRRVDKLQLFSVWEKRKSLWLKDIDGELLIISNFTLYGRNKKAGSVDFTHAAGFDAAQDVYNYLINELRNKWLSVQTGEFGARMQVSSTLDGPVNVVLEW